MEMINMARTKRVDSEKELEREVDDFTTRGFKIQQQSNQSARVKDTDWGDSVTHVFIFFFTLLGGAFLVDAVSGPAAAIWIIAFLANVVYAAYSRVTAEEVIIKVNISDI